jgi:hypothetical protein
LAASVAMIDGSKHHQARRLLLGLQENPLH